MENIENTEIVATEAAEEVAKAVSGKTGVLGLVVLGCGLIGGVLGVKLVKRFVIPRIRKHRNGGKGKKQVVIQDDDSEEFDLDEMEVDDLPDLDE